MNDSTDMSTLRSLSEILSADSGVSGNYRHGPKQVLPGEGIEVSGAVLKWYAVYARELAMPEEIERLARAFLARTSLEAKGLGFVILHRCGRDFYFLIVSTWRGNNEVWESVYYKDGEAMGDFALWPREGAHKPTFCVWELAAVWHEVKAWQRFLTTARDEVAAQAWLRDLYEGSA